MMNTKNSLLQYLSKTDLTYNELYTPAEAVECLVNYLNFSSVNTVWCPADKKYESQIDFVLRRNGYHTMCSHISDGHDFLKDRLLTQKDYDAIITNPPYTLKNEFLKRCIDLNKPFALLLPLTALGGVKRSKMFKLIDLQLIIPDKRINFKGGKNKKNVWFHTCWFTFGLNLPKQLNFAEL